MTRTIFIKFEVKISIEHPNTDSIFFFQMESLNLSYIQGFHLLFQQIKMESFKYNLHD